MNDALSFIITGKENRGPLTGSVGDVALQTIAQIISHRGFPDRRHHLSHTNFLSARPLIGLLHFWLWPIMTRVSIARHSHVLSLAFIGHLTCSCSPRRFCSYLERIYRVLGLHHNISRVLFIVSIGLSFRCHHCGIQKVAVSFGIAGVVRHWHRR